MQGQGNREVGLLVNYPLFFVCLMFSFLFVFVLHKVNFTKVHSYKILWHIRSYIYERRDQYFLPLAGSYPGYIFVYISHSVCVEKVFARSFLSGQAKPNISGSGQR